MPGRQTQPVTLRLMGDAAGNTDIVDGRHQNQIPPRERDMGSHASSLGTHGVLTHLHDQFLTWMNHLRDGELWRRTTLPFLTRIARLGIPDIQKRIACQTDIHKGSLHSRQHILNASLVDVAGDALADRAFHHHLHQLAIFKQRNPCLSRTTVGNQLSAHAHRSRGTGSVRLPSTRI